MKTSRRMFLRLGSAAALAGLISPLASAGTTRKVSLPLAAEEETLLEFVARYGARVRLVGMGLLEKLRFGRSNHAHFLIEVNDLDAFASVLLNFPFAGAYTDGNQFAFEAGGIEFTLENLLPRAFDERRAALAMPRCIAFAHDALSYDPATLRLWDPLRASESETVRSVNRTHSSISGLDVVLRGTVEAGRLEMNFSGDFLRWKKRLLRLAARTKDAHHLAAVFLRHLATLAETAAPETIKELLRSRSISSALQQVFGMDVEVVIAAFDAQRASFGGSTSNSAVWLSVLLAAEIKGESNDGAATTWLRGGTRFQVLRSRKALSQARELLVA